MRTITVPVQGHDVDRLWALPGSVARILLIEDDPGDADLVDELLAQAAALAGQPPPIVVRVARLDEAGRALVAAADADATFDAALLDLSLPDAHGVDTVVRLCAAAPGLPVVVMTGLADDRVAADAVHAGAQDYLLKGVDDARAVGRALRYAVERQALARGRADALARAEEARTVAEALARDNGRLLEQARRAVVARDDVLGIVSHDLRTPLSTVAMGARALREQPDADVHRLAGLISASTDWALRIVRDLLDVTAIEAGQLSMYPEPMTVAALLERVAAETASAASARGVHVAIERANDVRWVEADVDRLVQALGNLVTNAITYSTSGAVVRVRAHRIATGDAAGAVAFEVTDHGAGIPAAVLPHVFDRFWQARATRRGGAGLGLAITRGIAVGHGGYVTVESEPGRGSRFTLVLPDVGRAVRGAYVTANGLTANGTPESDGDR